MSTEKFVKIIVKLQSPLNLNHSFDQVRFAQVQTYGDTTHTFIERGNYKGLFLPGYKESRVKDSLLAKVPDTGILHIDHIVGNQPDLEMEDAAKW